MRNLRRMTLTQAHTMREMICETFVKFRAAISGGGDFQFHEDSVSFVFMFFIFIFINSSK